MAEFDFKELVARAHFDYVGPSFPLWLKNNKVLSVLPSLTNISRNLLMGGKYFTELTLKHGNRQYKLPNEPLISLSLTKTIVETPTVGRYRKGTVKEYVNTEDYQITLRGVCVNRDNPDEYPADQVKVLNNLMEINEAIEVVDNTFFELFEIEKIVLKSINYDEMLGEQALQKYTIQAVSDYPFFAELNEREQTRQQFLQVT